MEWWKASHTDIYDIVDFLSLEKYTASTMTNLDRNITFTFCDNLRKSKSWNFFGVRGDDSVYHDAASMEHEHT